MKTFDVTFTIRYRVEAETAFDASEIAQVIHCDGEMAGDYRCVDAEEKIELVD